MLSVTFSQPIVIDAANLHSLLSLANAPALVEPCKVFEVVAAPRPGRKPKLTNPKAEAPVDTGVGEGATPEPEKAKRTRRTKAEMLAAQEQASPPTEAEAAATTEAEPVAEATPVADAPVKKRGRKPAAPADKALGDAPKSTGAAEAGASGTAPDTAAMLERFAKLIDADFGKAKSALDEFGVNRFSDLKPDQLGAFNAKLTELGV